MVKGVFKDIRALILYIAAFVLSFVWNLSPMVLILGAGTVGLIVYRPQKPPPEPEGRQ
jgi:chromate transporter